MRDLHMYIPPPWGFATAAVGAMLGGLVHAQITSMQAAEHVPLLFQIGGGAVAIVLLFLGLRAQWRADDARDALALDKQLVEWKTAMDERVARIEKQMDDHRNNHERRRSTDRRNPEDTQP